LSIQTTEIGKEIWFKINDHDRLRPFFMNVVSDSNHWMFISSNGGLTAGRKNSTYALFPYYTDDKITESAELTGSKSIFQIISDKEKFLWEPFTERCARTFNISRNLYKNFFGNKILFEEVNHDLGLTFRYQWNSSNLYGFVRKSEIINSSDKNYKINLLDGIQNILPYGVEPDMQTAASNLVDAYKRSELVQESGLAIFALSAIIVDKAEPSEALKANIAWSLGLDKPKYLLSSLQLNKFRKMGSVEEEHDVKGEKGAYFVHDTIQLQAGSSRTWKIIANVNVNHARIVELNKEINDNPDLAGLVDQNIVRGSRSLLELVSASDGIRLSDDPLKDARHYSNVLFNIMRGGTFDNNYKIEKTDLLSYLSKANTEVFYRNKDHFNSLNSIFEKHELYALISELDDSDLTRLCKEYLPLKFSRRHGDPSRPWNYFSINTHSELDGSKILDYEGNWRDIFQNWEALVHSYPGFIEGMIFKFLNASTFDGYNPYRVTKGGFDWEIIEPDNPWSYIGYWGDHQIIYLLKFLEFCHMHQPGAFEELFDSDCFVYANVPYKIKSYNDISLDPKNTIDFDETLDLSIRNNVAKKGADGALLVNHSGDIHRVNFIEKMLATTLAKVSNFIPEGGIWMNTQRPEWNDANNALVGNGVSMVTLCYLRRFLRFFEDIIEKSSVKELQISEELHRMFGQVIKVLEEHKTLLDGSIDDKSRKLITDALGNAGSEYRLKVYKNGFSGKKSGIELRKISAFIQTTLSYLEHSIDANRRADHLYHAYNLMSMNRDGISLDHLDEMLEGQVAVLSSGYLGTDESLKVLDALRNSKLYRDDQNSYMLYPNKALPGFLEKNNIPAEDVSGSVLLQKLVVDNNLQILNKDLNGRYHFNGNFRNATDLKSALEAMKSTKYKDLVEKDFDKVLQIYEKVFNHKAFTGRSGTFYAYEGLGSIYWHMVSKLHLAATEVILNVKDNGSPEQVIKGLYDHFREIGDGIGIHKTPELYGAFPTDPYSHTPMHRGAQQPGMTGQVKEDILVSIGELGIHVNDGVLSFNPELLQKSEFSKDEKTLDFINIDQKSVSVTIPERALCFSYCQIPVIYQIDEKECIKIMHNNNRTTTIDALTLDNHLSTQVFERTGDISQITVFLKEARLL